jgi:hypothetical protein
MKRWTNGLPGATTRLGAIMALRGLAGSQLGCARIPMMVRSKRCSTKRPDTLMQLSRSSLLELRLATRGRAIHFGTKLPIRNVPPYGPLTGGLCCKSRQAGLCEIEICNYRIGAPVLLIVVAHSSLTMNQYFSPKCHLCKAIGWTHVCWKADTPRAFESDNGVLYWTGRKAALDLCDEPDGIDRERRRAHSDPEAIAALVRSKAPPGCRCAEPRSERGSPHVASTLTVPPVWLRGSVAAEIAYLQPGPKADRAARDVEGADIETAANHVWTAVCWVQMLSSNGWLVTYLQLLGPEGAPAIRGMDGRSSYSGDRDHADSRTVVLELRTASALSPRPVSSGPLSANADGTRVSSRTPLTHRAHDCGRHCLHLHQGTWNLRPRAAVNNRRRRFAMASAAQRRAARVRRR